VLAARRAAGTAQTELGPCLLGLRESRVCGRIVHVTVNSLQSGGEIIIIFDVVIDYLCE
jgi:hypothetical protein